MYKRVCATKGIKIDKQVLAQTKGEKREINSAKVELINRDKYENLTLPPIKHPSMHPKEKPFKNAQEEILWEKRQHKMKRLEALHV